MLRFVRMAVWVSALLALLAPAAVAETKKMEPIKSWTGSVDDEKLQMEGPTVITSEKDLEKLWKTWKIEDKMPAIDFAKEFATVSTTRGSRMSVSGQLDTESGDFRVLATTTKDLRPGFRYAICTFSREGVKTVNGKELGK